jgi:hypothetical protein
MIKNKKLAHCCALTLGLYSGLNQASENWSVQKQLNLPHWVTLKIDHRTRYEGYDSAFKKGQSGGDQVIAFRTNVFLGINYNNVELGTEFIDSRITLEGSNTPMSTSLINQTDLLQAYLAWQSSDLFNSGLKFKIKVGRQTMDVGSRRLIARNRFRNTINNFTGLDTTLSQGTWHWRNFVVLPVSRLPNNKASLRSGRTEFDQENFERILAGTFLSIKNLPLNSIAELYGYYLSEDDTQQTHTKNRKLFTPGFRWFKKAKTNQFDFEIETALQTGTSYATSSASDQHRLNHFAYFSHAALGYSFDAPWQPQLMLQYDYASGDKDPNDNQNNRFETLYGARRFEFGPTSIWGAFARANINSPGIRLKFKPHKTITGFIAHRAYWLAQSKDSWTGAKIRDVTGNSGAYIGQQMEMRLRWQAIPKTLQFETGWAHLFKGSFAKNAPNAPSNKSDVDYFYFQTSLHI